jgi:hypothetical protein
LINVETKEKLDKVVVYRGSSKSVIVGKPASQTEPELAAKQQERERERLRA